LVAKKGSKIRDWISSGMPGRASVTSTEKKSSSREVRIDSVPCPPMALTALSSALTRHYLESARNTERTTITV
jgi:hypothetical protein